MLHSGIRMRSMIIPAEAFEEGEGSQVVTDSATDGHETVDACDAVDAFVEPSPVSTS